MQNNQQYALITGATSGIGYELTKLFAEDGYNLVLVARDQQDLQRVASELQQQHQIQVEVFSADLFDPQNAFQLFEDVQSKGTNINVLVNDAGQGLYGLFQDTDIQRELDIIHLNIASLVVLTKKFLQPMLEAGEGKILNVASIAGKIPGPFQSVYHGTKAFVHSFTEAIRNELKDTGVTVTSLLPGATDTDFFNKADMENAKNVKEGSLADPADVAKDGYKALMSGDDKVVSGFKNKVQVAMGNVTPDSILAEQVHKQQEPADASK